MDDPENDYERIVRPLEARMMQSVWRILRDADDADDALQCALAQLWRRWAKLRRHVNPEALVLRVCIDAAHDQLRKRTRRRRLEQSRAPVDAGSTFEPSRQMEQEECDSEVMRAIASLPGKQRVAAYLRLVQECPYSAVAAALGCSEPTARKHVARGRERLRTVLAHLAPTNTKSNES